jgi:hypothetical protein
MKRIIYILALVTAIVSCQKELPLEPAISFFGASPEIREETAVFRLAYANISDSTERVIPVTIGGTAEKGIDYTISSDRFVFGGENPVDSIVVTTLILGTERTLSLSVNVPEGYAAGKYLTSEYTLQDKLAFFSLSNNYQMMSDSLDIAFQSFTKNGKNKALTSDAEIFLNVNKEKSTAIEGEDFAFADSSRFTIKNGQAQGSLRLKSLNPHPADGKDKIVLNLSYSEKYGPGATTEMEISLIDTLWKHLSGTWEPDSLVTDSLYMDNFWDGSCTGMEFFPKYNNRDLITFDIDKTAFTPSMKSEFKNYFSGKSGLKKGSNITLDLGEGNSADLQTFWLDNTNRYFSADQKSEDKESLIGLRFFPDNTDSLDFYIIDYVSKSFMPELETEGKYAPEKPVAASRGLFLNHTFTRQ